MSEVEWARNDSKGKGYFDFVLRTSLSMTIREQQKAMNRKWHDPDVRTCFLEKHRGINFNKRDIRKTYDVYVFLPAPGLSPKATYRERSFSSSAEQMTRDIPRQTAYFRKISPKGRIVRSSFSGFPVFTSHQSLILPVTCHVSRVTVFYFPSKSLMSLTLSRPGSSATKNSWVKST